MDPNLFMAYAPRGAGLRSCPSCPNWTFYSGGFEHGVLRQLARRWPLEYAMDLEETIVS